MFVCFINLNVSCISKLGIVYFGDNITKRNVFDHCVPNER